MVAINLPDFGSACGRNPSGAEPPKLRDSGVYLRPVYLGEAAQDSRVADQQVYYKWVFAVDANSARSDTACNS
jgi:hypothetical protein